MSTPILAGVSLILAGANPWVAAIVANLIGGCIFFFVDRLIFSQPKIKFPLWEISNEPGQHCYDCRCKANELFRIVEWQKFNWRAQDKEIHYRCKVCASEKFKALEEMLSK